LFEGGAVGVGLNSHVTIFRIIKHVEGGKYVSAGIEKVGLERLLALGVSSARSRGGNPTASSTVEWMETVQNQ
jgi:hypothetical protein